MAFPLRTVLALAAALGALGSFGPPFPAGIQECTTRCQTAHTECMLRCDGAPACQAGCHRTVDACVARCTDPPAGSSAPPVPGAPKPTPRSTPAPPPSAL